MESRRRVRGLLPLMVLSVARFVRPSPVESRRVGHSDAINNGDARQKR